MHSSGDQGRSNNFAIGLRGCLVARLTELETRYLRPCCSTYLKTRLAAIAAGHRGTSSVRSRPPCCHSTGAYRPDLASGVEGETDIRLARCRRGTDLPRTDGYSFRLVNRWKQQHCRRPTPLRPDREPSRWKQAAGVLQCCAAKDRGEGSHPGPRSRVHGRHRSGGKR